MCAQRRLCASPHIKIRTQNYLHPQTKTHKNTNLVSAAKLFASDSPLVRCLLEIHVARVGLLIGTAWLIARRVGFDDLWTFVLLAAALEILRDAGDFRQHAPCDVAAHIHALSC
jgi:hypothetical protein